MKKAALIYSMILLFGSAALRAQISSYNHSPVLVGQQDLHLFQGETGIIHPDSLISGDLDQADYAGYQVVLYPGENYSIKGNEISPKNGFSGILYVPCQVSDGHAPSNIYPLEVLVYPEDQAFPSLSSSRLYISPEGNDRFKGSLDSPFASLDRALEEVRQIKNKTGFPEGGIEILFREGKYQLTETIILDASVSGEKGKPLVIRSRPGEKVILQGGNRLEYEAFSALQTPGIKERIFDQEAAEKVLELDLKKQGISEYGTSTRRGYGIRSEGLPETALVVDGAIQVLARYPNDSYSKQIARVTDTKHAFITKDPHVAQWQSTDGIWLDGSICKPWEWSMNQVESINRESLEIRLLHPEYSTIDSTTAIYHFKNILEEIDMPGEYFIDSEHGKLYYLPVENFAKGSSIYLTRLKTPMLEIEGETSDVWLQSLVFENGRSAAISMKGERNKILNCEIRAFSKTGISLQGSHHEISGSHIHHIGMEAIILNSGRTDDRMLIPSCNVVKNSEVNDFSLWHRAYKPGLRIQGVGTGISHCLIHHGPHMGINIKGNDHVFEYNDVHHTPEEFSDMLSIYIHTASDPQHRGTVIRRNYFHDVTGMWKQGAGVYMDNETYGVAVLENFFHNSGGDVSGWATMVHGGGDNILRNNIYVDCAFPFLVSLRLNTYARPQFERVMNRWSRTIQRRYPFLDTTLCRHLIRYPELIHFFEDEDGSLPAIPYTFELEKNAEGDIRNYWNRRTPSTNVFENNLVYNSPGTPFFLGENKAGVREIREFYVVNGFRFVDGELQDQLIHSNNHLWKTDPGFVDYAHKDFSLREDAEVLKQIPGLDRIPFKKIGLR